MTTEPDAAPTAARRIRELDAQLAAAVEKNRGLMEIAKDFKALLSIAVTRGGGYLAVTPAEANLADSGGYALQIARSPVGGWELKAAIKPSAVPALVDVAGRPLASGRVG